MSDSRKKIIAGNWKMNMLTGEAAELARGVVEKLGDCDAVDVVLCPPFTALQTVSGIVSGTKVGLGAQNMHAAASGAHTGDIAPGMLTDVGCGYVILGHSERRSDCGETDASVNAKVKAAIAEGLTPIVCVGETLQEREADKTADVVTGQVRGSLADLGDDLAKVVVAYEPVWAIGTGLTATPEQAQEVHALVRQTLAELHSADVAAGIRIQYGGSMKPDNAKDLLSQPDIDGGLIGGAALKAGSFIEIVEAGL